MKCSHKHPKSTDRVQWTPQKMPQSPHITKKRKKWKSPSECAHEKSHWQRECSKCVQETKPVSTWKRLQPTTASNQRMVGMNSENTGKEVNAPPLSQATYSSRQNPVYIHCEDPFDDSARTWEIGICEPWQSGYRSICPEWHNVCMTPCHKTGESTGSGKSSCWLKPFPCTDQPSLLSTPGTFPLPVTPPMCTFTWRSPPLHSSMIHGLCNILCGTHHTRSTDPGRPWPHPTTIRRPSMRYILYRVY